MKASVGKCVLKIMALAAIFVCILPIYETVLLVRNMKSMEMFIPFDTGTYYLFFTSILITVAVIDHFGGKDKDSFIARNAMKCLIVNFFFVALCAPLSAQAVIWKLKSDGYMQCNDPSELSRVSRGKAYIFSLDGCESLQN